MSELISRADAIEAIFKVGHEHVEEKVIPLGAVTDYSDAIKALPSADAVSMEEHIKELNDLAVEWKAKFAKAEKITNEIYDETMEKVAKECEECKERLRNIRPSADAEPKWNCTANFVAEQLERLKDMTDEERLKLLHILFPSAEADVYEDYEHATLVDIKAPLRESAEAVQGDAISKRFISDAILQKISELNAQGKKAIPIAREFIRFKRFVDGLTPIRTDAVQGDGIPIELKKRYPHSRDEDITDAFMRGYQAHGESVHVVRCKDCIHQEHCYKTVAHTRHHDDFIEHWSETIEWCSRGEHKGGDDK